MSVSFVKFVGLLVGMQVSIAKYVGLFCQICGSLLSSMWVSFVKYVRLMTWIGSRRKREGAKWDVASDARMLGHEFAPYSARRHMPPTMSSHHNRWGTSNQKRLLRVSERASCAAPCDAFVCATCPIHIHIRFVYTQYISFTYTHIRLVCARACELRCALWHDASAWVISRTWRQMSRHSMRRRSLRTIRPHSGAHREREMCLLALYAAKYEEPPPDSMRFKCLFALTASYWRHVYPRTIWRQIRGAATTDGVFLNRSGCWGCASALPALYGAATISRLLKNIGLFCQRAL